MQNAMQGYGSLNLQQQQQQEAAAQYARDQALRSSGLLADIGGQRQALDIERLINLQAAGQNYRNMEQGSLSTGYEDYLRQLGYPQEQLGFLSNILQGVPVQPGTMSTGYSPQPSDWQQLLGAGIGGVGLYNTLTP